GVNSAAMPPAATPAACRSKPSQNAAHMQPAIVAVATRLAAWPESGAVEALLIARQSTRVAERGFAARSPGLATRPAAVRPVVAASGAADVDSLAPRGDACAARGGGDGGGSRPAVAVLRAGRRLHLSGCHGGLDLLAGLHSRPHRRTRQRRGDG